MINIESLFDSLLDDEDCKEQERDLTEFQEDKNASLFNYPLNAYSFLTHR